MKLQVDEMLERLRTAEWVYEPDRILFLRYFLEIYAKITLVSIADIHHRTSPRLNSYLSQNEKDLQFWL